GHEGHHAGDGEHQARVIAHERGGGDDGMSPLLEEVQPAALDLSGLHVWCFVPYRSAGRNRRMPAAEKCRGTGPPAGTGGVSRSAVLVVLPALRGAVAVDECLREFAGAAIQPFEEAATGRSLVDEVGSHESYGYAEHQRHELAHVFLPSWVARPARLR